MNFSNYKTTGNKAIDMCANLIGCARERSMPVKALHLKPIMYEWFKSGVTVLMDKELDSETRLEFDTVNICKGSKFQTKDIVIEYYETAKA